MTTYAAGSVTGLTDAEAAAELAAAGPNAIPERRPPGVIARVLMQLRDPMILLLIAAAALTATLHDLTDLIVILVVIVLNTAVGVVQEVRAEHALSALRRMTAPHALVVRSGRVRQVAATEVVPGDVVLLQSGDIVPADLRLTEAARLQVDEAELTGESVPVDKGADDEVFAGTVVTTGRGLGVVVHTGADSAIGQIAGLLMAQRPRPTPLQRRLADLSRILSVVAVSVSALVALIGLIQGRAVGEMVVTAVSLTVAAVPESLPAVITLALALGARRMAQRAAVLRRLPAVETLGAVTVVAADKTGTLTEGRMVAERIWVDGLDYVAEGNGYEPDGRVIGADGTAAPAGRLDRLLRAAVLCNDADLRAPEPDRPVWGVAGDPLEGALLALAARGGVDLDRVRTSNPRIAEVPFDSLRRRMTTVHRTDDPKTMLVISKGAPELIADDEGQRAAASMAAEGFRVLAVADGLVPLGEPIEAAEHRLRFAGLVAITDPVRGDAAEVVRSFREAGVDLLMITGDAPGTARSVAARIGLDSAPRTVVTGDDLAAGSDPGPDGGARVFARIRPEQKLDIVRAWQAAGEVVAMTGDGVNDAPALRRADIGVAMGDGGTEVARQAADLVLTDDDLRTVVSAIAEGRRIYTNVRTFLRYALSGGLAEVVVMLIGPLLGLGLPLLPAQILWINMLTHGLPGVAIGAEPADPTAVRRGPRPASEQVLGGGLWWRIAWTGVLIAAVTSAAAVWAGGDQTVTFLVLGLAQLGVAVALRRPREPGAGRVRFLDIAVGAAAVAQVAPLFVPPLNDLLGLGTPGLREIFVAAVVAVIPGALVRFVAVRRTRRPEPVSERGRNERR